MSKWSGVERQHLSFKFVFLLLRVNEKLGGVRGQHLLWYGLGVFFKFYYLRVNINVFLYNLNLTYSEFFPILINVDNPSLNLCVFLFFSNFFSKNRCTNINNFEPNLKLSLILVGRIDDGFDEDYFQTRSKTQTDLTLNWLK